MGYNAGHANLIPPVKGEVRNPNGRPSGARGIKTLIRQALENHPEADAELGIWAKTVTQALDGDKDARRDITNYLYGKPVERVESKDVEEFTEVEEIEAERERLKKEKDELSDGN